MQKCCYSIKMLYIILQGNRNESSKIDERLAQIDADDLFEVGVMHICTVKQCILARTLFSHKFAISSGCRNEVLANIISLVRI